MLLIDVVLRWRRLLLVTTFAAVLLTFIVLLFFPNWYTATTSIMPPENDMGGLGMGLAALLPSGVGTLLGGSGLALPGLASPSDLYAGILKSRVVSMGVVEKNNLKEIYKSKLESEVLEELFGRTTIDVHPEGIISVSYEDKNPERAAEVANSFISELNKVNTENLITKAKYTREFIEERLQESIVDLKEAEENMQAFQKENKTFDIEEQVKANITAIALLQGELALAEIELGIMKKSLSPTNVLYKNQNFKIEQIKEQISKYELGDSTSANTSSLNIPMAMAPDLGLEYVRLMRELKIQETIFELLKQQYEHAKIQEMRDTPTIQVLDIATIPDKKSRPKRAVTALVGGILCFGLTLFFVLIVEFVDREKKNNSDVYRGIQKYSKMLDEDFHWIRSMFHKKGKTDVD